MINQEKAIERARKQYAANKKYNAAHYERISLDVPKGTKERIKKVTDDSFNHFVGSLVINEIERLEKLQNAKKSSEQD